MPWCKIDGLIQGRASSPHAMQVSLDEMLFLVTAGVNIGDRVHILYGLSVPI